MGLYIFKGELMKL